MGRKKVEMKRIEDKSSRLVTFSKRRNGLIKKARELSVLCDVEVALLVVSSRGKTYDFCSTNSLAELLRRYQDHFKDTEASKCANRGEDFQSSFSTLQSYADLLQIVERNLEDQAVEKLRVTDLVQLEKQLNVALMEIRCRKTEVMMESIEDLHEKERMLREENELLGREIMEMNNSRPPRETLLLLE